MSQFPLQPNPNDSAFPAYTEFSKNLIKQIIKTLGIPAPLVKTMGLHIPDDPKPQPFTFPFQGKLRLWHPLDHHYASDTYTENDAKMRVVNPVRLLPPIIVDEIRFRASIIRAGCIFAARCVIASPQKRTVSGVIVVQDFTPHELIGLKLLKEDGELPKDWLH